jgi:hypothetical protein
MPVNEGRAELTPNLENFMSRKSPTPPPMPQRESDSEHGFALWITLLRGISPHDELHFERELADYLDTRDLQWWGTHLHAVIWCADRELTETDQVDLLVWLIENYTPTAVQLGPLGPLGSSPALPSRTNSIPVVRAQFSDLTVIPISWLYRAGRASARQVLEMLGGYTTAGAVH